MVLRIKRFVAVITSILSVRWRECSEYPCPPACWSVFELLCFFVVVTTCLMIVWLAVEMVTYLSLYVPALDWILQCMAHKTTEVCACYQRAFLSAETTNGCGYRGCLQVCWTDARNNARGKISQTFIFTDVKVFIFLLYCSFSGLVLNAVMSSFKPEFVSAR